MFRAESVPTDPKQIFNIIQEYKKYSDHYVRLEEEFKSNQAIMQIPIASSDKPDNRLVNNYPGYISTVNIGYFMGKPVNYTGDANSETMMEDLQLFLDYNDEQDENVLLEREASIKGTAYEIMYIDDNKNLRIAMVRPENTIVFRDNTLESNILFAIRYWDVDEKTIKADLYTEGYIQTFQLDVKKKGGFAEDPVEHVFEDVPIIEFPNNEERMGDFERVITLINAYDKSQSDTANDFEYFTDAYLLLRNLSGTTDEQLDQMKKKRILLIDGDGEVGWVTKTMQDSATENYKTRLDADIHKFSLTPKLTDEDFAGNLSGIALEFKLWGLEQLAAQKERKFKKALQRRIELFCNFMSVKGRKYDWRSVDMTFTRNMPMNVGDLVEQAIKLKGIVSDHTLLSRLPFINDPKDEMDRLKREAVNYIDLLDTDETTEPEDAEIIEE